MVKISNFIIAIAFVGLIVGGLSIFFGALNDAYTVTNYDDEEFEDYQHLNAIYNQTQALEEEAVNIDPNPNPLQQLISVIDGFFTGAYNTLVLAWSSFETFDTIADKTTDHAQLGQFTNLFKVTLSIIVIIMLVLGVIVSAIIKKDI